MARGLQFAAVGDVLPVRPLVHGEALVSDHLAELVAAWNSADVAFANFEMPLTDRHRPIEKLLTIRASPSLAPGVARLGFDVVNVANNHAVDHGYEGLEDTVAALQGVGLDVIGAGPDRTAASAAWRRDVRGTRVAIVPFSCLVPAGMAASDDRPGISPIHVLTAYEVDPLYQAEEPGDVSCVRVRTSARSDDLEWARAVVADAAATSDVVLVSVHWGYGSGSTLAEYQRPLAHALIEAGAHAILGHHPHAIHGVEIHDGHPVLYSPGTFIGQQKFLDASPQVKEMWAAMSPDGYVAQLAFDGEWSIRLVPITLDAQALPQRARDEAFARIYDRLKRLSLPLGTAMRCEDGAIVASPA